MPFTVALRAEDGNCCFAGDAILMVPSGQRVGAKLSAREYLEKTGSLDGFTSSWIVVEDLPDNIGTLVARRQNDYYRYTVNLALMTTTLPKATASGGTVVLPNVYSAAGYNRMQLRAFVTDRGA